MKRSRGFTVVEIVVVLLFLIVAAGLFYNQKFSIDAASRDSMRKTSINAMYYSLEEVFYEKNRYYPQEIDSKTLRSIDPELFSDPDGLPLNDPGSTLQYEGKQCSLDGKCKQYTLTGVLEKESDYVKNSRRK